jgi:hypothetical protein
MKEMPKWLKEIWRGVSSKSTIIGWILLLLGNLRHLSDLWDSLVSVWGKMNAMAPFLQICGEYAKSPTAQLVLTVCGFLWIALAAYRGAKKADLSPAPVAPPAIKPTVSAPAPAAEPAAPSSNSQSTTTKGPASQIIDQINQIKSPLQQDEFAKTFTGMQVDWILYMVSVHTHDPKAFTLFFRETEMPSLDSLFLISVAVPLEGHDYLRFAAKGTKFRVTGKISGINLSSSYIYVADATLTPVS